MQVASYYKFQARAWELRAEIAEMKKDGRKLRKLGVDTARLDAAIAGLETHARDLSEALTALEAELFNLLGSNPGEER